MPPRDEARDLRRARPESELRARLAALDGRGYPAYRALAGLWRLGPWVLAVEHVQGDPFAEPSRVRLLAPATVVGLPPWAYETATRRVAAADYLHRALARALARHSAVRGSGHSGQLRVPPPSQAVLRRSAVLIGPDGDVELRLRVGLPARGRRISASEAWATLGEALPAALREATAALGRREALRAHVATVEDAQALRAALEAHGLVAFVADGSVLPRRSGVDDRPLPSPPAVPFRAPPTLRRTLLTPHAGAVAGLGVPRGVTLIVGGGFHGKSTLLRALQAGVVDHVPDDGRERVVTDPTAVKLRAEDGRAVAGTDLSNLIGPLPGGVDTHAFVTQNASGSTSQAASLLEALEMGARVLLLDEDTSATNLLLRDARMQRLVPDEDEPIRPFVDRVRRLYEEHGVSTVLVVGGAGDYLDVADTVIGLRAYDAQDRTADARAVVAALPSQRRPQPGPWAPPPPRALDPTSLPSPRAKIRVRSRTRVEIGGEELDLSALEQLRETAQTRTLALALRALGRYTRPDRPLPEAVRALLTDLARSWEAIAPERLGELAEVRPFELAAALLRWRPLRTRRLDAEPGAAERARRPGGDP